jgi:hypothetical protein
VKVNLPAAYRIPATARGTENEKSRRPFQLAGIWNLLPYSFSGHPTGEPRRNYRYRDNNAYYNDVENKSADVQLRLAAKGREVERAVGTTIGHSIFQSEEMGCLTQAKPV